MQKLKIMLFCHGWSCQNYPNNHRILYEYFHILDENMEDHAHVALSFQRLLPFQLLKKIGKKGCYTPYDYKCNMHMTS